MIKWLKKLYQDFTAGTEYRGSLEKLIEYLPVGDIEVLHLWVNCYIKYLPDETNGAYDRTKEFQGADLTIRRRAGDCEDIAAVFVEVIRAWKFWQPKMVYLEYADGGKHAVAFFITPSGGTGWFEGGRYGQIYVGELADLVTPRTGRKVARWHFLNDMGYEIK